MVTGPQRRVHRRAAEATAQRRLAAERERALIACPGWDDGEDALYLNPATGRVAWKTAAEFAAYEPGEDEDALELELAEAENFNDTQEQKKGKEAAAVALREWATSHPGADYDARIAAYDKSRHEKALLDARPRREISCRSRPRGAQPPCDPASSPSCCLPLPPAPRGQPTPPSCLMGTESPCSCWMIAMSSIGLVLSASFTRPSATPQTP